MSHNGRRTKKSVPCALYGIGIVVVLKNNNSPPPPLGTFACVSLLLSCPSMLPLSLLRAAQNHPMLVELKNGETYNGHLVSCDNWMNLSLREVICTSKDGDRFWRLPECYIRGSNIKYLRIPDEVIELVREEVHEKAGGRGGHRGGRGGGRGGHRGGRGGRRK